MSILIKKSNVNNSTRIPCSKSYAHRALLCALLAFNQESVITSFDVNDDLNETISVISSFLINLTIDNNLIRIKGLNKLHYKNLEININYSASTLRFFIPVLGYLCDEVIINVSEELFSRPLDIYEKIFQDKIIKKKNKYIIKRFNFKDTYIIDKNISSQFVSGLLFVLPLLTFDSKIILKCKLESLSYILMTIEVLKAFNINITFNNNELFIKGNQKYKACLYDIEMCFSSFSYIAPLGLNNKITINNFNLNSKQGDRHILEILSKMGAKTSIDKNKFSLYKSKLSSIDYDMRDCIDLVPCVIVLCLFANGLSHLKNTYRLIYKESNRAQVMKKELAKLGINIVVEENDIYIQGINEINKSDVLINPHHDHRIFMSFVLLSILFNKELLIQDETCVKKSFNNYLECLKELNINYELRED